MFHFSFSRKKMGAMTHRAFLPSFDFGVFCRGRMVPNCPYGNVVVIVADLGGFVKSFVDFIRNECYNHSVKQQRGDDAAPRSGYLSQQEAYE